MKKALITGCQGFIAQTVAQALTDTGHVVRGVCLEHTTEPWQRQSNFSVRDLSTVVREVKPDVIFHGAGAAGVGASLVDPDADFVGSVLCFQRLLEAVRLSGLCPHVIFPSSAAVYGNRGGILHESMPPLPIAPYGFHKWNCELLGREYAEIYGIPVTVARLFSVFGPNQRRLIVWEIFEQARKTGRIHLRGTGDEIRDYLPVTTLAEMLARLPKPDVFRTVNVASGKGVKVCELAETVRTFMGGAISIGAAGLPIPGDPAGLVADVTALRTLLESAPDCDLADCLSVCFRSWADV